MPDKSTQTLSFLTVTMGKAPSASEKPATVRVIYVYTFLYYTIRVILLVLVQVYFYSYNVSLFSVQIGSVGQAFEYGINSR